jgi:transcriptional regulator PpsR
MMSQGPTTWTKGLIPMIEPGVVAGILSRISDIALIVSETGLIKSVSSSPDLVGKPNFQDWVGLPINDVFTVESVPKFDARLKEFLSGRAEVQPIEVNHKASEGFAAFPVRYSFHATGASDSILMLGRDLTPVTEMQQQLVAAQIALENDYEAQRDHDLRFRVLMESTDVATMLVSAETGQVTACNGAAEALLGKPREQLIDAPFERDVKSGGDADIVSQLVSASSEQIVTPINAHLTRDDRTLMITPTLFRSTSGQILLCKLKTAGAQDSSADQLQSHLVSLFQKGTDSIVFVNAAGYILSSNDAFLKVADITHAQSIQGRPMVDFLSRGSVDLNVMLENARRTGSMRLYATKVITEHGAERSVEISTTQLIAGTAAIFAMIIRDSRRVDTVRTPIQQVTEPDMGSVVELIGGHSLKDIVAKTTDVVERMCIETAVEMTSNNRVAAAEMLGLSRQSLYVKLRKYDLVNKG